MILCLNLNPSLDLTLFLHELIPGKVHRSEKEILIPGGKGINIAKTLKVFREEPYVLGFSGGITGTILEEELRKREISFDFIRIEENIRFAIGIIEKDKERPTTVINGRGPEISENKIKELKKKFEEIVKKSSILVLSGSIPKGVSESIYSEFLEIARDYKGLKVLDIRGEALKLSLLKKPEIIKPNKEEAEEILDFPIRDKRALIKAGNFFQNYGIKYSLISLGENGAFLATEKDMYLASLSKIKGFDWGAGDAFLSGFIVGIKNCKDPIYALKLACATGYMKVQRIEIQKEDIPLINKLVEEVRIEKIN